MTTIKLKPGDHGTVVTSQLKHVYAVDALMISYHATAAFENEVLTINTATDQSCRLFVPWQAESGLLMLSTSSLPTGSVPYQYELEVARGTVGGLIEKFATWREEGTEFSEQARESVAQSRNSLANAIYSDDPQESATCAARAIERALNAMTTLVDEYGQTSSGRVHPLEFGVNVGRSFILGLPTGEEADADEPDAIDGPTACADLAAANMSFVAGFENVLLQLPDQNDQPMSADIAFIRKSHEKLLKVREHEGPGSRQPAVASAPTDSGVGVGPILDWKTISVDDWFQNEADLDSIRQNLFNWGEAFGRQLSQEISPVHVAAGIGAPTTSRFNDQQRLQLTLDTMCGIHQGNPSLQQLVSFYQPLGSEIDPQAVAVSPLHAADALLRTDVGLQRIGIEVSFNGQALPSNRGLILLDNMLDGWEQFDLPLTVFIELPEAIFPDPNSGSTDDSLARMKRESRSLISLLQSKQIVDRVCFALGAQVDRNPPAGTITLPFQDAISQILTH